MLTIAGTAVVMDIVSMRISNGWILCSLLCGFLYSISGKGPCFREFVFGTLIPAAVLGGLCWFRMLGAGDIKLLCSLGGIIGPESVWRCMGVSFFIGAVFSLLFLVLYGNPAERLWYLKSYIREYLRTGVRKPYYRKGSALENFHFTVPIFMSVMLYAGGIY